MKKQVTKLFTLCVMLFAIVSAANAQNTPRPATTPESRADFRAKRMQKELNLTDAQVVKVKEVLLTDEKERMASSQQGKTISDDNMMKNLGTVLTPEQMKQYTEIRKQQTERRNQTPAKINEAPVNK